MSIVVTSLGFKRAVACHVAMGEWVVRGVTHLSLIIINYLTAIQRHGHDPWLAHPLAQDYRTTHAVSPRPPPSRIPCRMRTWLAGGLGLHRARRHVQQDAEGRCMRERRAGS